MQNLVNLLELEKSIETIHGIDKTRLRKMMMDYICRDNAGLGDVDFKKIQKYISILKKGSQDEDIRQLGLSNEFSELARKVDIAFSDLGTRTSPALVYLKQNGVLVLDKDIYLIKKEGTKVDSTGLKKYFAEKNLELLAKNKNEIPSSIADILSKSEEKISGISGTEAIMRYKEYSVDNCTENERKGYEFLCTLGVLERVGGNYQTTYMHSFDEHKNKMEYVMSGGKYIYIAKFAQKLLNMLRDSMHRK